MSAVPTKRLFDPDRKTQLAYVPSISLLQGKPYIPAADQSEYGILAMWRWERGPDNPENYPEWVREER